MQDNASLFAFANVSSIIFSMRKKDPNLVTGEKIAEAAGVSPGTVSRVFRNHPAISQPVRERVIRIAREMGYNWRKSSRMVALIIPEPTQVLNIYFDLITKNMIRELKKAGYLIELIYPDDLGIVNEQVLAGAVSIDVLNKLAIKWAARKNIPLVCVNDFNSRLDGIWSVCSNDRQGIQLAVDELLKHGHRKIGMISYTDDILNQRERGKIFHELADKYHLTGKNIIIDSDIRSNENFLTLPALSDNKLTGLIYMDENRIQHILYSLKQAGIRVPDDISLIGGEVTRIAPMLEPPLTTIGQNFPELARQATLMLKGLISGKSPRHDILVDYTLRSRQSIKNIS